MDKMARTFDVRFCNIIVLGLAFMLIFTAFQTCSMAEKTVINSARNESNGTFTGNGYTSLGIIYAVFSVSNWGAPSFVTFAGPKISMFIGSITYFLFVLSFLKPMVWALYTSSALVGIGAAIMWTGQGNFLTINSDSETVARNSGVFWALLQCSLLFGNLYSYLMLQNKSIIDGGTRVTLFIGLSAAGLAGTLCLLLLRKRRITDSDNLVNLNASSDSKESDMVKVVSINETYDTPLSALKRSFQLLKTKEMLLLSVAFGYTGLELTFFSGVYGTCIAQNSHFPNAKGLLGISGMLIGAGEIVGGVAFSIFGKKTNKYGRDPIVLLGYIAHLVAFFIAFVNLPMDSPVKDSIAATYIDSSPTLALFGSFLLGFGDSSFNTQLYSILGYMYQEDSSPAFSLFKFMQSITAAAAFYYSDVLLLNWQLLILVIMGTCSVLSFSIIEWEVSRTSRSGYQTI